MTRTQVGGALLLGALALVNVATPVRAMTPVSDGATVTRHADSRHADSPRSVAARAIRVNGITYRPFVRAVLGGHPVSHPGEFVGMTYADPGGEVWYAGRVWVHGQPHLQTGP